MLSDIDKVILIKDQLREKFKWNEWFRGVRITTNNNGKFMIKIMVPEINNEITKIVPINFEGVDVILVDFAKEEYQGE
jgi:hypothetical protein